jgi:hypothetical protein
MVLDVVVKKNDDGFTAEVPSLKGCESWAPNEDDVLEKVVEMAKFYLCLDDSDKVKLDKARGTFTHKVYKLVFYKH